MSRVWKTLINASELASLVSSDQSSVIFDCRHVLTAPEAGLASWREAHIPGAYYSHLDTDQAGPHIAG